MQNYHEQNDFSGGEITQSMLARADTEQYARSVLQMENFYPTEQGTAERIPGSRFMWDIVRDTPQDEARIIPYLTPANERALVVLTPGRTELVTNVGAVMGPQVLSNLLNLLLEMVRFFGLIIEIGDFRRILNGWQASREKYTSVNGDYPLGIWHQNGRAQMIARAGVKDADDAVLTLTTTAEVEVATDVLLWSYAMAYYNNIPLDGGYILEYQIRVDNAQGKLIASEKLTGDVGQQWNRVRTANLPDGFIGTLWVEIKLTALDVSPNKSTPHITVDNFQMWANFEREVVITEMSNPYASEDLPDLHFVQSPYGIPPNPADPGGYKELVVTHPKHPPHHLWFDPQEGTYKFEEIQFANPPIWGADNYPATCTSFMGRLILAGGAKYEPLGSPIQATTETVWGTKVGKWNQFSLEEEVDPDDSIEVTSIYRSPIQWVYGHKTLLVGSLEYEYIISADGIFSPGDLGVDLHSTEGSRNVQPVVLGEGVLFASNQGRDCRFMSYSNQDGGWVALDVSALATDLLDPQIKRMVRLRNPRQIAACLLDSGDIAMLVIEDGVQGWFRYTVNGGKVEDICVMSDDEGNDVLYMTVQRWVEGERKLYLEAVGSWAEGLPWHYLGSYVLRFKPGNTIRGLRHLEGKLVAVAADGLFLGTYRVNDGEIDLTDLIGDPYEDISVAAIGLYHPCTMVTLPPRKQELGAKVRYSDISVRVRSSTRPIINGESPADRDPMTNMNRSQGVDDFTDHQVAQLGTDLYQFITIEETVPLPVEILAVYGKITSGSL